MWQLLLLRVIQTAGSPNVTFSFCPNFCWVKNYRKEAPSHLLKQWRSNRWFHITSGQHAPFCLVLSLPWSTWASSLRNSSSSSSSSSSGWCIDTTVPSGRETLGPITTWRQSSREYKKPTEKTKFGPRFKKNRKLEIDPKGQKKIKSFYICS